MSGCGWSCPDPGRVDEGVAGTAEARLSSAVWARRCAEDMPHVLWRQTLRARHHGGMPDSRSVRPARPKPPRHPHAAGTGARSGSSRDPQRTNASGARRRAAAAGTGEAHASASDPGAHDEPTQVTDPAAISSPVSGSRSNAPEPGRPDPAAKRRRPRTTTTASARATAARRPTDGRRGPSSAGERTPRERRPHPTFSFGGLTVSVRLLGIAVVGAVLAGMLVPSLFQWWRQEQDLRDITARVAAAEQDNADMQHQLDLWNDPDYIASQARSRLGYVLPGETQYAVVDPGADHADTPQIAAAEPQGPARPWVQVLTASLTEADAPRE